MWPRLHSTDYRIVAHYLGSLLAFIALTMVAPLLIAIVAKDWDIVCNYLISIGITWAVSGVLRLCWIAPRGIDHRQALIVTALIWLLSSIFAAIPLYMSGHYASFIDSVFDTISGYTDTGVCLVEDVNRLDMADNFWRHFQQLIGGQGIVLIMLGLSGFSRLRGASLLYEAEGREDRIIPVLAHTTRFIIAVSAIFASLGIITSVIALMAKGVSFARSLFHASCLTFAAFGTGGFTPMSSSTIYYHSFALEVILMVVMLTGAFSFAMYFMMLRRGAKEFFRDIETRTVIIWILICTAIFAASMARDPMFNQVTTLFRRGIYTVISAATNTGFSNFYVSQITGPLGKGALFALILAMAMGGATNSTTGGIKAFRVASMFKSIVNDVRKALLPERAHSSARYHHLGDHLLQPEDARKAMTIFILYTVTYLLGGILGVALGFDPLQAMFESVSVTSNSGLTAGVTSPSMPDTLKLFYMFSMLIGRLEFLTVMAACVAMYMSIKHSIGSFRQRIRGGNEKS